MDEIKTFEAETTIGVVNKTTGTQVMLNKKNEKLISIGKNFKKGDKPFCVFQGTIDQLETIIEKSKRYDRLMEVDKKEIKKEEVILTTKND